MGPEILIIGGAGLVALVVIVVGIISVRSERDLVEERLGRYEQGYESFLDIDEDDGGNPKKDERKALDAIDKAIAKRPFAQRWRTQLARADLKLTVAEFAALHVVSVI